MNSESRSQEPELTPRPPARTFQQLIVWQKAHQFVLTAQFRRAAISIPANIAEGFKKRGRPDKARFLNIAQGSVEECRYFLILAKDLKYGETTPLVAQLEETSKLLESYVAKILASDS